MTGQLTPTRDIRRQLKFAASQGALLLLVVAALTGVAHDWRMASQCLLQSSLIWAFAWHQAWRRKTLNYDVATAQPFAQLGSANRLTLLRGALIAAVGGFLFQTTPIDPIVWLSALLYTAAAILDRFDGFAARRSGQISQLGSELDTAYDALGLMVAPLLAASYGKVHWSYRLVSIAYYVFQGGLRWRRRHARPVHAMTPSKLRRTIAGFQMGFVSLALWPVLHAEITRVASFAFMLPLLIGFVIDWLTITGRIRPESSPTAEFFGLLMRVSANVLQPIVRIALATTLLWLAQAPNVSQADGDSAWRALLFVHGLQVCAISMAMGVVARIGALFAFLLLAVLLPEENINALCIVAVGCAVFVAVFGAGRFSIWQADDAWVNRND